MNLEENLNKILSKYDELQKKVTSDEVINSPKDYAIISKEISEILPTVDLIKKFKEECKQLKIPIVLNDNLVRGLDYYNNICYEFVSDKLGSQDSFLAGGRYDGLIKNMGGPDYPGCGFAVGLERMLLMYKEVKIIVPGLHLIVIAVGKENKLKIMKITNQIRNEVVSIAKIMELIFKDNLSKGLKYASEKNASHAIILGEEEISQKLIILRDLRKKTQTKIAISKLIEELSNL